MAYEDNFGFWDIHGSEEQAFFDYVQRQSVLIACERCERPVPLIPPKALCASCVGLIDSWCKTETQAFGTHLITHRKAP